MAGQAGYMCTISTHQKNLQWRSVRQNVANTKYHEIRTTACYAMQCAQRCGFIVACASSANTVAELKGFAHLRCRILVVTRDCFVHMVLPTQIQQRPADMVNVYCTMTRGVTSVVFIVETARNALACQSKCCCVP